MHFISQLGAATYSATLNASSPDFPIGAHVLPSIHAGAGHAEGVPLKNLSCNAPAADPPS